MANKKNKNMSQAKQEFFNSIEIRYDDFRTDPARSRKIYEALSVKAKREAYLVKPYHMIEALWLLRKYIRPKTIKVGYIDGDMLFHVTAMADVFFKNGLYGGSIYLSNSFDQTFSCGKGVINFGPENHQKVKEFFKAVREMRDYIEKEIYN